MSDDIKPGPQPPERELPCVRHDEDHEQRLLEFLDGRTSPQEDQAMLQHLEECAQCSATAREWAELDAQLAAHFKPALLSSEFSTRVWSEIESLPPQTTAVARRAGALPASDEATGWGRFHRGFFWSCLPAALDHLGYAFAIVLAVCLSGRVMSAVLNAWPHTLQSSWLALLVYGLGVSAPISLLGFGWLAKRPLGRLLTGF